MTSSLPRSTNVSFEFSGQTVIVTGAARGIGAALVASFEAAGADVIAVDLDVGSAGPVDSGSRTIPVSADVSRTHDVEQAVAAAIEHTGRVDVLINNAGILRDKMLWKLEDDDWDAVLGVHLTGTFKFTRACVPQFRAQRYGRVINVTSYTGLHGNPGQAAYAAAKAGIIGFTKTAAKELARFGVTVNAISPNAETRMIEGLSDDARAALTQLIPLGRFAPPQEIAATVAFLASAEAGYITGAVLPVDGGMSM